MVGESSQPHPTTTSPEPLPGEVVLLDGATGAACTPVTESCVEDPRVRRRALRQSERRRREHQARCLAARCAARYASCRKPLSKKKLSKEWLAGELGISSRTLRRWCVVEVMGQRNPRLNPRPRGRRARACDVVTRNRIIQFLHRVTGPAVGLEPLRALFPQVPRGILADLLRRYRRVWRSRYRLTGFRLRWHHAGTVWAMDHSEACQPIDGIYRYIFAVRDLASGYQLAWRPVLSTKSDEVLSILGELFQIYGSPLILKSDNGSAFISEVVRGAMLEVDVRQLFSPAGRPKYNGALERSNSTLKTYTQQHAVSEGHPFRWTTPDLEHARFLANTISRPRGHRGPTPDEAWLDRPAITPMMRETFAMAYAEQRAKAATSLNLDPTADLNHTDHSRCDRLALSRTLERLGYLTKTRVDCPPKKPARLTRQALHRALAKDRAIRDPESNRGKLPVAGTVHRSLTIRKQESLRASLASSERDATMPEVTLRGGADSEHSAPSASSKSPRREATPIPWWRWPITPLLSLFKPDKITH